MITDAQRLAWVFDGTVDYVGLEQFATSIAALAQKTAKPLEVLDTVLESIAENLNASCDAPCYSSESVLSEKAQEYGFRDINVFREEASRLIGHSMIALDVSKLSAVYRTEQYI